MRVLVVGAGAVGGWFGAALARAGVDVTFLVRSGRAARLHADGLALVDPEGERSVVDVRAVTADELTDPADLVLLAVKATAVEKAVDDVAPAVGPGTAVLPLLNGVRHVPLLVDRLGPAAVLGGLCLVATRLAPDGAVRHLAPGGSLRFGELDGSATTRLDDIAAVFAPAAFATSVSSTIEHDMWEKWHFMAAGGATGVLLGGPAGGITAAEGGAQAVTAVLAEASAVLAAAGHPVRDEALARARGALLTPSSPFTTSLYRDFADGMPTEVEPVVGDMVRRAAHLGVPVPLLAAAAVRLRVHEAAAG